MRVALCLSGQPRNASKTFPFILKNIIEPNNADVFIHMNYDPNNLYIERGHKDNGNCLFEPDIDKKVIEWYKPKSHMIEPPRQFANPNVKVPKSRLESYKRMNSAQNWSESQHRDHIVKQTYRMFYSIFKCNELKESYALSNGFVYDYVIRLRFDTYPEHPLQLSQLGDQGRDYLYYQPMNQPDGQISDWMNIGGNTVMNAYSSIYMNIEYLNSYKHFKKEERNTVNDVFEDTTECGGFCEYMVRDVMKLFKIEYRPLEMRLRILQQ